MQGCDGDCRPALAKLACLRVNSWPFFCCVFRLIVRASCRSRRLVDPCCVAVPSSDSDSDQGYGGGGGIPISYTFDFGLEEYEKQTTRRVHSLLEQLDAKVRLLRRARLVSAPVAAP